MIDAGEIKEFEAFFDSLPRPLPVGLEIFPGVKVRDAETFVRVQLRLVKSKPEADYAAVALARLVLWKRAYLKVCSS